MLPKGILLREFAVYRVHILILYHVICRKASKYFLMLEFDKISQGS